MAKTFTLLTRLLCIALLASPIFGSAQQTLTTINGWNAYVHLPDDYNSTGSQKYPTIIFLPGTGEVGTYAPSVLTYGPGYFLANGWNGYVTVNGKTVKPIIISLQPPALWPAVADLDTRVQTILSSYRVDPTRLSLTGLSMGGWASEMYVMNSPTFASRIASVVAMTAVKPDDNPSYPAPFATYAKSCGHWLGYEQINDFRDMQTIANTMNAAVSGSAVYIQTNVGGGGHCCWNTWYDPSHTDTYSINGATGSYNIYQFMMSYAGCSSGNSGASAPSTPSTPPSVSAGSNQTITLPAAGSSANISTAAAVSSTLQSSYFNLSNAPDNITGWTNLHGSPNSSVINATSPSGISISSVATANWSPVNGVCSYDGNGVSTPGFFQNTNITVNNWYNYGDPQANFNANTPQFTVGSLSPSATYDVVLSGSNQYSYFNTDPTSYTVKGATTSSPQSITTVNTGSNGVTFTNVIPAANGTINIYVNSVHGSSVAGMINGIQIIPISSGSSAPTQPSQPNTASATLSGSATAASGATIASTVWKQSSGPSSVSISSANSLNTSVSGLVAGTYVFTLTATDNNGLSGSSNVTITVDAAAASSSAAPIVSAGPNQTITLPTSSVVLQGSATAQNGGYVTQDGWSQTGGSPATITSNSLTTTITGLTSAGTYVFTLSAVDNSGNYSSSNVTVTVNGTASTPAGPSTLAVSAGPNQTISLPTNTVVLVGSATPANGASITQSGWSQTSGTPATITSNSFTTTVTGLTSGTYVFTLSAWDNEGNKVASNVTVTVKGSGSSVSSTPPLVSAGLAQTITGSTVNLSGSSSGTNGASIVSNTWTEVSGGSAAIASPGNLATAVSALTAGSYVFALTATDANGLSTTSNVTITVNATASSGSCGCTITLSPPAADGQLYIDGSQLGLQPGNTVCLKSAHYVSVFLYNFAGAPGNPINIVNCGGPVTISGYNSYGFILSHSSYIHISGAGDPNTQYGIQIDGGPASTSYGYSENGQVRDIEVDHFEVKNIAGVGMGCAPTPSCDPTTWSTAWKMYNISFHDNYVHDTQGEGFYIGNTQYDYDMTCNGTDVDAHPQQIDSVKFYNNTIANAGWTAAQISQVTGGVDIHDNLITNYGAGAADQHQAGIIVGEFSHGSVYRNRIIGGSGNAFQCFGSGVTLVYNNIFANAGFDGSAQGQPAIFADDRPLPSGYPGLGLNIINNTIYNPARNGISFYNDYGTVQQGNLIANNLIIQPGILGSIPAVAYFDLQANPHATTSNNTTLATGLLASLVNLVGNDFHLTSLSPAINAGMDVSSYGITTDIDGNKRPFGPAFDCGAYEFTGAAGLLNNVLANTSTAGHNVSDSVNLASGVNEKMTIYPNPAHDVVNINWSSAYTGKVTLTLYDALGRTVQSSVIEKDNQYYIGQLFVSSLTPGVYYLKVQEENGKVLNQKILKQ